jgi:class 3 adenylate cyclase
VADDAAAACRAGKALMDGFASTSGTVLPRGGLAYGKVLPRGGDYYGTVVNLAARLVDEAVPQELLATEALADAAVGCEFEPAGRRMVKGFAEPVTVRSLVSVS